jgi:hypothetical protein
MDLSLKLLLPEMSNRASIHGEERNRSRSKEAQQPHSQPSPIARYGMVAESVIIPKLKKLPETDTRKTRDLSFASSEPRTKMWSAMASANSPLVNNVNTTAQNQVSLLTKGTPLRTGMSVVVVIVAHAPARVMPSMRSVGEATEPRNTRSFPIAVTLRSMSARFPAMVISSTAWVGCPFSIQSPVAPRE